MPLPHGGPADARWQDKPGARRAALTARRALTADARAAGDRARDAVLAPLLAGCRVASYEGFGTEPVAPLPPGALVPVLLPDRDLAWHTVDGAPGRLEDVDVVLVPALLVDRTGIRLGRGGGSYDRALPRARGLVVALLHEGELVDALPAQPHDVRVAAVALPSGLVRCSGRMVG